MTAKGSGKRWTPEEDELAQVANRGFQTSPLHRNKIETNTGGGKGTREKVGAEGEGEMTRCPLLRPSRAQTSRRMDTV